MLIKDMNKFDRPRERLEKFGGTSLTDEELLAILIKTGTNGWKGTISENELVKGKEA